MMELACKLTKNFLQLFPADASRQIENRPLDEVLELLKSQSPETGAALLARFLPVNAAQILEELGPDEASMLVDKMEVRDAAQVYSQWDTKLRKKFLAALQPSTREEIVSLMNYPQDKAAYYMDPRVMTFHPDTSTQTALAKVRSLKKTRIFDVFVVDDDKKLVGVVSLENLVVSHENAPIRELMDTNPIVVKDFISREEAIEIFNKARVLNLPVVNFEGRLLGVIRQSAMLQAVEGETFSDLQTMVGAGSEERALSKVWFAVRKRLPWLHINLATAFLAAAVVGIFENTIARFTALAVLLPVVAGQSGNCGAQALAVTLRGLALREVRVRQWFLVTFKEARVGLLNGVAVAITTSVGVYIWSRSWGISLVIGVSMIVSMMVAGLSGAMIPMILTSLKQDPAQSSSIFLTTVTDIVGFLSFLGLATLMASFL